MFLLRNLFPSFEKPVERQRYLNVERQRRDFRGVGTLLLLAVSCGVAFALWEPSHRVPSPFVTASLPRPAEAVKAASQETTAASEAEDDQPAPTVKLSAFCAQRTTARRDCADVKAVREARLKAQDTDPAPAATAGAPQAEPRPVAAEVPDAQPPRPAATPKAKRVRQQEEAPVERLVRVYDQILPDGRRVPVYRRVGSGAYETGTIVDGEYRPTRRANLEPPAGRLFGLQ